MTKRLDSKLLGDLLDVGIPGASAVGAGSVDRGGGLDDSTTNDYHVATGLDDGVFGRTVLLSKSVTRFGDMDSRSAVEDARLGAETFLADVSRYSLVVRVGKGLSDSLRLSTSELSASRAHLGEQKETARSGFGVRGGLLLASLG